MRTINTDIVVRTVRDMCINANLYLAEDMENKLKNAADNEDGVLGKQILDQLIENLRIAGEEKIPICQDTGMAVFFVNIGQDLHIEGISLTDAINEGVRQGYKEGYLRKSVVGDPLLRVNTGDNTPAIVHYDIVPGDKLEITIAPKGFGSENMSKVYMLKPSDGEEGVKAAVLDAVKNAGPNACPPLVVGVGLGGDFELAAKMAKKALTRDVNSHSSHEHIAKIEKELLEEINNTGIGPGGLGGKITALAVNIESYATHIAGMPLAVNMCCHVNRHVTKIL
ncbi:MAG: fumarate hydratase [Lachnospiraceae bacterium]|nr:fumarate hydratase [Lachnospiraceae bacterium]